MFSLVVSALLCYFSLRFTFPLLLVSPSSCLVLCSLVFLPLSRAAFSCFRGYERVRVCCPLAIFVFPVLLLTPCHLRSFFYIPRISALFPLLSRVPWVRDRSLQVSFFPVRHWARVSELPVPAAVSVLFLLLFLFYIFLFSLSQSLVFSRSPMFFYSAFT